jgi:hypothetical protein
MTSLTYSALDAQVSGQLCIEIVNQMTQIADEAVQPSSIRFHMATSLGGALLILATLLCRSLQELGLQNYWSSYVESFNAASALLHELASGLLAARRIEDDLKDVVNVVRTMLDMAKGTSQQQRVQLPDDVNAIFPYGAIDFAQQAGNFYELFPPDDSTEYWNAWNGVGVANAPVQQGYGAPWL